MGRAKREAPAVRGTRQGQKTRFAEIISKGTVKSTACKFCAAKIIAATDTQRAAYASTGTLRETESQRARAFFRLHPRQAYSRAMLSEEWELPINHVTRIVYDLIKAGFIEVAGRAVNPRSKVSVEVVRLVEKGGGNEQ